MESRWITVSSLRLERTRLVVIAGILAISSISVVVGYRDTYPTAAERIRFADAFKGDLVLRLFYGVPRDIATVAGFAEFRLVGILSVITAGWAVFAASRALRGEEEAGRWELMLSGAVGRGAAALAAMAALLLECVALWLSAAIALLLVGVIPGDFTVGQAMLTAAAFVAPATLFATIGGLACQLAGTTRGAQALGGAALAAALLLRIAADTAGMAWLRWASPLGWAEEIHPVTGLRAGVFALFAVATLVVGGLTVAIAARRDVARGLWPGRRTVKSHNALLGSPTQAAARDELPTLLVWLLGAGTFAVILGAFSKSIAEEAKKSDLNSALGTNINTASGYLALSFVLFGLVIALFAAAQVNSIHGEESSGRLETLFGLPTDRMSWLAGRLALGVTSCIALSLAVALLAWVGAAARGAGVGLGALLAAGANCIPAALLFLGIGTLLFAVVPRHSGGATIALVGVAFLWELIGAAVGAPSWVLSLSPYEHVSAVPQSAFDGNGATAMLVIGTIAAIAGGAVFVRRDIQGA